MLCCWLFLISGFGFPIVSCFELVFVLLDLFVVGMGFDVNWLVWWWVGDVGCVFDV